jgi:hypothetical protein
MGSGMDPATRGRIEYAVRALAQEDHPRVWIGEPGMTAGDLMALQLIDDECRREAWEDMGASERHEFWQAMPDDLREAVPEQAREAPPERWDDLPDAVRSEVVDPLSVEPGAFVEIEDTGAGVRMPGVSIDWLDGLWVVESMADALPEHVAAELEREVLYIRAAKEHKVPLILHSWESMAAGLGPLIVLKPVGDLVLLDVDESWPEGSDGRFLCRLEELEFYVEDTMGPYVVEDSPRARSALRERLDGHRDG